MNAGRISVAVMMLLWDLGAYGQTVQESIDAYLDARWDAPTDAIDKLIEKLRGLTVPEVEKILREGRATHAEPPQPRGKYTGRIPLTCEHVDYSTEYLLYVPKSYDPKKAVPLVIAGHGGSAARDRKYGEKAAIGGTVPFWTDQAEKDGFLLAAPITSRGWGAIGNSVLFSLISKLQREYRIDPDRIYVTGHSMGGHLSWRCGLFFADRWGAVGPMSGGYDFVESKAVYSLFNVPGYVTYGTKEPYEINPFNNKIKKWMEEHAFPWKLEEKAGGHEIFPDEVPKMAKFFAEHPRNLYPTRVFARGSGGLAQDTPDTNPEWDKKHAWTKGRAIPISTFHWIRLVPLPSDTPKEKETQTVWAVNKGGNTIEVTSQNVRKLRLYLHDKMVNFDKPVRVVVNGEKLFDRNVTRDLKTMLELVREFDDRGRIFHAAIDLEIATDKPVAEPTYK